ncbi:uncharacterized protein LOC131664471 [Phymastichus coffea]|uniref:uncharacterized protein LOC131664471 n=1 Tax=Phymastichus coffea TaxID=108790 RepID=UPI00273AC951|nr:uncharacterized protein LOC131664471 [Phymastichus coffea]
MASIDSNEKLNQDPDYYLPLDNDKNQQSVREENARSTAEKISKILETEFSKEIETKKKEVFKIYETLHKACKVFHYLRFAIVTDYYNQEHLFADNTKQSRLHPTVNAPRTKVNLKIDCENDCFVETNDDNKPKRKIESESNSLESDEPKKKIFKKDVELLSSSNRKTKIRIVVGNYSKWIPPHNREQNDATHKWTLYVIDSQKSDLGNFVSKVRFFLHPSYQPNDVIELTSSPFHLSRLGWGEFPVRVQLHFKNNRNKPVDIIHNLTLDRTYTGILTIGSETVVDIWLITTDRFVPFVDDTNNENKNNKLNVPLSIKENKYEDFSLTIKGEKQETDLFKQNDNENVTNTIIALKDHDYIRTNFIPIKLENNKDTSTNSSITFKKNNNKSLLKNAITVSKGNVFSSNQNHNFYELPLSTNIETSVINSKQNFNNEQAKPENLFSILKLLIQRIPLITEKSKDSHYKSLFPYACESYQVFSNFSSGKQHALERYQALHALDIMKDIECFESSCSVYEFMIWARRYGYTPVLNFKTLNQLSATNKAINVEEVSTKYENTATISTELNDWLLTCQNIKPSYKEVSNDSEDEIDIINIPSNASNQLSHYKYCKARKTTLILLNYPQEYHCLNEFVYKSAEQIGIKLSNEEIIPGVSHSSATLVITKALVCLVDELVRSALACAIDKCNVEKNFVDFKVEVDDVHKALLKREEFDIFTNSGLGSEG